MQIAIIDEEVPYPMNSGKRLRTMQLLSRMAKIHEITFICHRNKNKKELLVAVSHLESLGIEVVLADPTIRSAFGQVGFYAGLVANLFYKWPFSVQSHSSPSIRKAIFDVASLKSIDLWHFEWTPYAHSIQFLEESLLQHGKKTAPCVIMAHNIESLIWQRYFTTEKNLFKKWYIGKQHKKYTQFEKTIFKKTDCLITVSEADAMLARDEFGAVNISVVENGVDTDYFSNLNNTGDSKRLLFLGSLDWRPNLHGLHHFLNTALPEIVKEIPAIKLCIVGRNPPAWLKKLVATMPNVELHGNVPDVRTYIESCGFMIVPLDVGGGSRLKILEAAAANLPVISTRVGAEGLRLSSETHYKEAPNIENMAPVVVDGVNNIQDAKEMAMRAQNIVQAEYGWDAQAKQLDLVWRKCAREYVHTR